MEKTEANDYAVGPMAIQLSLEQEPETAACREYPGLWEYFALPRKIGEFSTAVFSPDRKYRYGLLRVWDVEKPLVLFIGLNPSTADEIKNDPTIRRCIDFAKRWGCGGLLMGNIFAFRSTDPKGLLQVGDPVGPDNDQALRNMAGAAKLTIAAWGNWGELKGRGAEVARMLPDMLALGITNTRQPKHPLYLPRTTLPATMGVIG